MAAYTVKNVTRAGVIDTLAAVASIDTFANDGKTILVVDNASGGALGVTFDLAVDPNASEPAAETSATSISVPAGERHFLGPFPTGKFGTTVTVNYDSTATITAGAFRLTSG